MSRVLGALSFLLVFSFGVFAQNTAAPQSQELSEDDGVPVIIKHLPDWESVRDSASLIKSKKDLREKLGAQTIFDLIDFEGGTEAATASYAAGKLLIVEYNTPQASIDADNKISRQLADSAPNPPIYYRRVGNYNVFVFDAADETAANALIDQIKYEKVVQWLGEDPFLQERYERHQHQEIVTTSEVLFATVGAIVLGVLFSAAIGIGVGAIAYYLRRKQRSEMEYFSDAGGMLRLNLDDLTPNVAPDRLLKD